MTQPVDNESELAFGPFRFLPFERRLFRGDEPVPLGSRAQEILSILIERAGHPVSKHELINQVWPDTVVEEGALRVHIAALRKTLVDGETGTQYVQNIHGVGYRFAAPLTRLEVRPSDSSAARTAPAFEADLPISLTRMIGRAEILAAVASRLPERRFMTLTGPAGIGKTTLAVAAAHLLQSTYQHGVKYIDLASANEPAQLANLIAWRLGIQVVSADHLHRILAHLREQSLLIVLDNCEHLVAAIANLVERLLSGARHLHILTTSREPLRAQGEWVVRLEPLDMPEEHAALSARAALQFSAIQLFTERAQSSLDGFELQDAEAPIVTDICRRLDGLPLAIELAAAHVYQLGVRGVLARITTEEGLAIAEHDEPVPRHQTLEAALDWSYRLLSPIERLSLQRLSVFRDTFSLEAAQSVAADSPAQCEPGFGAIASLVAKSLVSAEAGRQEMCYRLLETTRVYALQKLIQTGERDEIARRHALYYRDLLEQADGSMLLTHTMATVECAQPIGNIRAALEWSFSPTGDCGLGVTIAATAAPFMLDLSLLTECYGWMRRSIDSLDTDTRGTRHEMEVQAALASSLLYTQGSSEECVAALTRAIEIATRLQDPHDMLRLFAVLHVILIRIGDFQGAFEVAQRGEQVARSASDSQVRLIADSLLGVSHHLIGDQTRAQSYCQSASSQPQTSWYGSRLARIGYDHRIRTLVILARTMWLRGFADQAVELAEQAIEEARKLGHPIGIGFSQLYATSVFLWVGRWTLVSEVLESLLAHTERHGMLPYYTAGLGLKAGLVLEHGDTRGADQLLQACQEKLNLDRNLRLPVIIIAEIADTLMKCGRWKEALAAIDEVLSPRIDTEISTSSMDAFHTPELLRIRARILALQSQVPTAEVEICLERALQLAHRQSALAWELRVAMDLARLWRDTGQSERARELLTRIYNRFTEGLQTPDLISARGLLGELQ